MLGLQEACDEPKTNKGIGIRAAILDGDIDKALKHTKAYYANVLEDYPHIHFKLRCRKFIEMMRHCNELSLASNDSTQKRRRSASSGIPDEHAVFDQEMELDDGDTWDADGMDTENNAAVDLFNQTLHEAVQYGQQLRTDYPSDANGGDKKMLEEVFSLVAYPDPTRSINGHYLDIEGRVAVAEELNSAILGKSLSVVFSGTLGFGVILLIFIDSISRQIIVRSLGTTLSANRSPGQ